MTLEEFLAQAPEPIQQMLRGARQIVEAVDELKPPPGSPLFNLGTNIRATLAEFEAGIAEQQREREEGEAPPDLPTLG